MKTIKTACAQTGKEMPDKKEDGNMQFIVKAYDGKGMLEKRMAVRPRHLEGMKALGKQIICAGGLLDEEGRMRDPPW